MKKLLLLSALLIFACTDDEGNPCVYEPTLTTEAATDITETSATLNGVISLVSGNCEVAPGGYSSSIVIEEKSKNGIIILSNASAFNPSNKNIDKLCLELMEALIKNNSKL